MSGDGNLVYVDNCLGNVASGSMSAQIASLSAETTYYYRAFVAEYNASTSSYEYRYGSIRSFTTEAAMAYTPGGWLEMPGYTVAGLTGTTTSSLSDLYPLTHKVQMDGKLQRNYSCLYDPEMYASYWVAYPLCYDHLNGSGRSNQWAYDPDVPSAKQTDLLSGAYGVNVATTNYESNYYSRGHQIANSDRNGVDGMCDQTFYMTNLTPQLQNGFNGGVWNNLEQAVQSLTNSCDTVYVVTGAAFRKKGGSETVTTIVNSRDSKTLPVPNYYWKALLKVSWTGSAGNRKISAASAIGFWLPHADLKGAKYADYAVSVDELETYTGIDIFANLPDILETDAETNTSWTDFKNF